MKYSLIYTQLRLTKVMAFALIILTLLWEMPAFAGMTALRELYY
jgi:hypothetical protein